MMIEKKQRSCNLDVIRIFAFLCVVSVHFFLNSGFYDHIVEGSSMFLMTAMRNFYMICVPLFMILSGYLLKDKAPCKSYYIKIFQTLGIYLLASMACAGYKLLFDRENFSFMGSVLGLFTFSTAPYSWYIEMYIGLFLIIPFLNRMYNGMTQKRKKLLIGMFLVLTALPSVMNIWQFFNLSWWLKPSVSQNYDYLVPDYWIELYPITYYFIGCYLREYPLKLKRSTNLWCIFGVFVVSGVFNVYRSLGEVFVEGSWSDHRSFFVTIQSVLVFNYLNRLNLTCIGEKTGYVLKKLSSWTLGAYLCSSVFDNIFYNILMAVEPAMEQRILYFPVIVLAVSVCSLALSAVLHWIYTLLEKLVEKCARHRVGEKS